MLPGSAPSGMPASEDSDAVATSTRPISSTHIAHPVMSRDLPSTRPPGPFPLLRRVSQTEIAESTGQRRLLWFLCEAVRTLANLQVLPVPLPETYFVSSQMRHCRPGDIAAADHIPNKPPMAGLLLIDARNVRPQQDELVCAVTIE